MEFWSTNQKKFMDNGIMVGPGKNWKNMLFSLALVFNKCFALNAQGGVQDSDCQNNQTPSLLNYKMSTNICI